MCKTLSLPCLAGGIACIARRLLLGLSGFRALGHFGSFRGKRNGLRFFGTLLGELGGGAFLSLAFGLYQFCRFAFGRARFALCRYFFAFRQTFGQPFAACRGLGPHFFKLRRARLGARVQPVAELCFLNPFITLISDNYS